MILVPVVCMLLAGSVRAQELAAEPRYFYHGLTYGSDASFHPVSEVINGAFGIMQISTNWAPLDKVDWRQGLDITWRSITHPVRTIDAYGTADFIHDNIVPDRVGWDNLQYVPNYCLHGSAAHAEPRVHRMVRRTIFRAVGVGVGHHDRACIRGGNRGALCGNQSHGGPGGRHASVRPRRCCFSPTITSRAFSHTLHMGIRSASPPTTHDQYVRERGRELWSALFLRRAPRGRFFILGHESFIRGDYARRKSVRLVAGSRRCGGPTARARRGALFYSVKLDAGLFSIVTARCSRQCRCRSRGRSRSA